MNATVLVYGAAGHTGRFVVDELVRRGLAPVLAGRSSDRLRDVARAHPSLERRVLAADDDAHRALGGVGVVVNCAGPFLDTAPALARAAVGVGAHYLDVSAEQASVLGLYRDLDAAARSAGVVVVPAMGFYGAIADLIVTAVLDGGRSADEVDVAIALDRWWPTAGTRATGARNTAPRVVVRGGELAALDASLAPRDWSFPAPFGTVPVAPVPFGEVVAIARHLDVGELRSLLSEAPLADLRDPTTPPPAGTDELGRSPQRFVVDVRVRGQGRGRRAVLTGRDIYAVTAPVVAEGVVRLLDGRHAGPGALAPAEAFDAPDVLAHLVAATPDLELRAEFP